MMKASFIALRLKRQRENTRFLVRKLIENLTKINRKFNGKLMEKILLYISTVMSFLEIL
jgi:hypothetical protein